MELKILKTATTVELSAETDKFTYAVNYDVNGKVVNKLTVAVTRKLTEEDSGIKAAFIGSVSFINGNLSSSILLTVATADRIEAITDASAIYDQIVASVAATE